jgi:hypothetical protein
MSEDTTAVADETTEETTETAEEFLGEPQQKVLVGPHPLGGLRFAVWDRQQGTYVEQRIDIPEAAMLNAHLGALLTMAFQTIYAQQAQLAQQASSGLIVPGR